MKRLALIARAFYVNTADFATLFQLRLLPVEMP